MKASSAQESQKPRYHQCTRPTMGGTNPAGTRHHNTRTQHSQSRDTYASPSMSSCWSHQPRTWLSRSRCRIVRPECQHFWRTLMYRRSQSKSSEKMSILTSIQICSKSLGRTLSNKCRKTCSTSQLSPPNSGTQLPMKAHMEG